MGQEPGAKNSRSSDVVLGLGRTQRRDRGMGAMMEGDGWRTKRGGRRSRGVIQRSFCKGAGPTRFAKSSRLRRTRVPCHVVPSHLHWQPASMAAFPLPLFPCHCGKVCKSLRGLTQHQFVHRALPQLGDPSQNIHRDYHPLINGKYPLYLFVPTLTNS